ncbi:hypothetical protein FCV25MIE_17409, partial [Fagus crenata]
MEAASSSSGVVVPSLFGFVFIKLDRTNYPLWLAQIVPILKSKNLMGFVTGRTLCPLEFKCDRRDGSPRWPGLGVGFGWVWGGFGWVWGGGVGGGGEAGWVWGGFRGGWGWVSGWLWWGFGWGWGCGVGVRWVSGWWGGVSGGGGVAGSGWGGFRGGVGWGWGGGVVSGWVWGGFRGGCGVGVVFGVGGAGLRGGAGVGFGVVWGGGGWLGGFGVGVGWVSGLALAGKPINDDELVTIIMNNVGPAYEVTVSSAQACHTPISYDDLVTLLLTAEMRLKAQNTPSLETNPTTMYAPKSTHHCTCGHGSLSHRGSPMRGRGTSSARCSWTSPTSGSQNYG